MKYKYYCPHCSSLLHYKVSSFYAEKSYSCRKLTCYDMYYCNLYIVYDLKTSFLKRIIYLILHKNKKYVICNQWDDNNCVLMSADDDNPKTIVKLDKPFPMNINNLQTENQIIFNKLFKLKYLS